MAAVRPAAGEGVASPLGVTLVEDGINVAVVSEAATDVHFCLFDGESETARIRLPARTGNVHHGFIAGIAAGQRYGLRAAGPFSPSEGHVFDPAKLLVDPYAVEIDRSFVWHPGLARRGTDTAALVPKCVVASALASVAPLPPARPQFIYEASVKSLTQRHPDIPEKLRGKVAALGHPAVVEHLVRLGVDTLEVMPLMAWIDERHLPPLKLSNAWGYNPITFLAPDPRLAPDGVGEIREAVASLHKAGIRVVLDVVFNHSGESDAEGPVLSLRGLDNRLYYRQANGILVNDTGCGNTLATDRAAVLQLIMDAMRHWVRATGIDGFRYDLATVLGRTPQGFEAEAPLLSALTQDPLLSPLIHIAEPWDVGPGGYALGRFPAAWHEWNDRFRDDVRHFWRGDSGAQAGLATRLAGSSDIFAIGYRRPSCSINYVAAHDGFTLKDAVTYARKENSANGENNRDGNDHEVSWKALDPHPDVRALLATLFLSRGTPMLTAGDEFGRSQKGNNNAYAQDNAVTWLDWANRDEALNAFTAKLAAFRAEHRAFFADRFLSGTVEDDQAHPDVAWLAADGQALPSAGWQDPRLAGLGMALLNRATGQRLCLWFNRGSVLLSVKLPDTDSAWEEAPGFPGEGPVVMGIEAQIAPRSVAAFLEKQGAKKRRGLADRALHDIARKAGIQDEWWEVDGTHHVVSVASKRALLEAMNVPLSSAKDALGTIGAALQPHGQPIVVAAKSDQPVVLSDREGAFALLSDMGTEVGRFLSNSERVVSLPPLSSGCYRLLDDEGTVRCFVLSAPPSCYLPPSLATGRSFGLAAHLYALRHAGDWGVGDFETLAQFGEATARLGGRVAGLNPLHHMFTADRSRVSPYQPSDRRFIDPIYIDVNGLTRDLRLPSLNKSIAKHEARIAELRALRHVDYESVWHLKEMLLAKAFETFDKKKNAAFEAFIAEGSVALQEHAAYQSRVSGRSARYAMFLQWVADMQLSQAAARARLAGLEFGFYRDLALGCAYEGGEVAADPSLFSVKVSLGAPPDPFSRSGQIWNLPPFNPLELASRGFAPMSAILKANMRHAGVLRIDHILGYVRQFWVPRGGEGRDGAYVSMNTEALIAATAIASHEARCIVIGEDLGTVPDGLRHRLAAASILSYRMLWFEQDTQGFLPASSYPHLSAACLSSHDLAPFKGWRQSASATDVQKLGSAIAAAQLSSGDLLADAHSFVASAPSALMLIQADDLTEETEPLNVPGTDREKPNWRRRLAHTIQEIETSPVTQRVLGAVKQQRG
jgi:glycogen operon protein